MLPGTLMIAIHGRVDQSHVNVVERTCTDKKLAGAATWPRPPLQLSGISICGNRNFRMKSMKCEGERYVIWCVFAIELHAYTSNIPSLFDF